MKSSVLLRGAWQALLKNKKRSFLTMIGIIIGISAVSTIISIGLGFENYMVESLSPEDGNQSTVNIWFQSYDTEWSMETNEELFTIQDFQTIEKIIGVEEVNFHTLEVNRTFDQISYGTKVRNENIEMVSEVGSPTFLGRELDNLDEESKSRVAVLPLSLAEEFESNVENLLGRGIRIANQYYAIVGIYENIDSQYGGGGGFISNGRY